MMDFLDPKKKRAYNIRLFIGFVLIAIVLVLGTLVLALITAGYSINRHTGQVYQNGLIFISAHPQNATIYVNGVSYGQTTARLELPEDNYNIVLKRPGYRDWSNSLSLQGGSVVGLDYPFLFPTKPSPKSIITLPAEPNIDTESPDLHWLLVSVPGQLGTFDVVDVTNLKAPITTITIPSNIFTHVGPSDTLQLVKWSNDSQHVLLKHNYQGGYEYIMLDRADPADSFNINQMFSTTTFTDVRLDNNEYSKLYLYDPSSGVLSLGNTTNSTVTPVLSNVLAYWPYSTNEILYATSNSADKDIVVVNLWVSGKNYTIRDLPVASSYLLNIADYSSNSYVVVGSSSDNVAYVYMNPIAELSGTTNMLPVPFTILIVDGSPENITFSTSARFIALQSSSEFAVYDIETDTHYRYDTNLSLSPGELATWMDGNRLMLVSGGKLNIFDFDGTNLVPFISEDANFVPGFNSAFDMMYTVSPSTTNGTQFDLYRTNLIVQ